MHTTPPDRFLIPTLSLCNFVIGVGAFGIIGLVEPLGDDLQLSAAQTGQLLTAYAVAYALLSPLLVASTGRVGRRRIMAAGFALFALAAIMSALSTGLTGLNIARVLAAAGAGIFTPLAAAVAASLSPEHQRAKVLAAVFFGLTMSQVVGVPASSWIAYTFGWRWTFWLIFAMALPCVWLIWTRVPAGLKFQPVTMGDLRDVVAEGRLMLAIMFTATFIGSQYILFTYIAPLLSATMGFGRDGIAMVLMVSGFGAVAGNVLGGFLSDRYGWRITLTWLCIAQMCVLPVFSLLPMSVPLLIVFAFLWAMGSWSFMAAQQVRLITIAGHRAPVVLSLNAAAIYVGAAIGSAVGGLMITGFGLLSLGITAGVGAACALVHLTLSARLNPLSEARP
ncbi:MFS transporter [Sulfitobacter guttiformis]|uniref:Putative MFS family arabinose efflux permease n=1 Tax=Sulfitobacter guttiformis TaxID=74349 RepID=A0A420DJW0_9RHOB|nr:MFS transporter [Sulfitobacter guttiformis]KIN71682.1 Major facilitator superfamily protein [Sulfitobacter guttiformis KCTC 32187]RKE94489.1 putative MFS family arabinose efflux permease [Sulfitobacter guttiformis]